MTGEPVSTRVTLRFWRAPRKQGSMPFGDPVWTARIRRRLVGAGIVALALVVVATAGCLGVGPSTSETTDAATAPGGDAPLDERPEEAPAVATLNLSVGDRFHHEVEWASGGSLAYPAIVVENRTSTWLLATDNRTAAIWEAQAGAHWITLGPFAKDGLAIEQDHPEFPGYYELPLRDGTTWTRQLESPEATHEVTFRAEHQPAAETPLGAEERYRIEARTANGTLVYRYDLVPRIGWFSQFEAFDPDEGGAPEERLLYRIETSAVEAGWTGSYYVDEAEKALGHAGSLSLLGLPDPGAVDPDPAATFQVPEGADYVHGWVGAYAGGGAQATHVVDPNGTVHRYAAAAGPGGDADYARVLWDAVPGRWSVSTVGAGGIASGWAFLWTVTEHEHTLG